MTRNRRKKKGMRRIRRTLSVLVVLVMVHFVSHLAGAEEVWKEWKDLVSVSSSSQQDTSESRIQAVPSSASADNIPDYNGTDPVITLNGNVPEFSDDLKIPEAMEEYGELDTLGRVTYGFANVCKETMPTEERGEIGMIKPTGWHTVKYDCVDGLYCYNRCHCIAFCLAGENANPKNLITGTRYLNVSLMLPYEEEVLDYVNGTDHHVLYRVIPVFEGDNLLCKGVHMEAWSVEDEGQGVQFNIFAYNIQPGIGIDYATGDSWEE